MELLQKSAMVERSAENLDLSASVCQELGYHALAIAQAGAYIAQSCSLADYLQLYHEDRDELLQRSSTQTLDGYKLTVYTTWEMSMKKLSPSAATLLRLFAFLHHDGISEEIFRNAAAANRSEESFRGAHRFLDNFRSQNGAWKHVKFLDHIKELASYSLINGDNEKHVYSIHPLVHAWVREQGNSTERDEAQSYISQILVLSVYGNLGDEALGFWRSLVPHIDQVRTGVLHHDFASMLHWVLHQAGRLKEAEELGLKALEAKRRLLGNDHPGTLRAMGNLASTCRDQGQLTQAEELELEVLEARRLLGSDHPDMLHAMSNLASTYREQGRLKQAEELELEVLEARRRLLGSDHPDMLHAMSNLASTYWGQGRLKQAEELALAVLEARRRLLGNDHPDMLRAVGNLASTYWSQGQLTQAEELELEVLEVRRRLLGNDHPDTLRAMGNLASIHRDQGQLKKGEELELEVLEARRRLLGNDHPDTLLAMGFLASTYRDQGRLKEAEELELEVLEARRRLLGNDHPDTLWAMGNLAFTYRGQGRLKQAEELELEVLEARRGLLGNDHPDTLRAMGNLASMYQKQGRLKQAHQQKGPKFA